MLAIVEGTDKLDKNAIAFDCSDDGFRSVGASLCQVLHRTTACQTKIQQTICAKMITDGRGADLFFRINMKF